MIDSQSVKTESGGPRGYDAGKKIQGRKRHAMVVTDGRPLVLQCHAASVQDCDGAIGLLHAAQPESLRPMAADEADRRALDTIRQDPAPLAATTLPRPTPEVEAECVSSARSDLSGGAG